MIIHIIILSRQRSNIFLRGTEIEAAQNEGRGRDENSIIKTNFLFSIG